MNDTTTHPDPADFHYYDQPQEYDVEVRFTGRASIAVRASTREEAEAIVDAQLDEACKNGTVADLLENFETDDPDVEYASKRPTRMYLVDTTGEGWQGQRGATSRIGPDDKPRPPTALDHRIAERTGYVVSWKPEDVAPD